jgi:hypothetical protein
MKRKRKKTQILDNMEELVKITEEKMCYVSLFYQIYDYMVGNVSLDSSPMLMSCESWLGKQDNDALKLRNAVAILLEDASESTKKRVLEELVGKYEVEE